MRLGVRFCGGICTRLTFYAKSHSFCHEDLFIVNLTIYFYFVPSLLNLRLHGIKKGEKRFMLALRIHIMWHTFYSLSSCSSSGAYCTSSSTFCHSFFFCSFVFFFFFFLMWITCMCILFGAGVDSDVFASVCRWFSTNRINYFRQHSFTINFMIMRILFFSTKMRLFLLILSLSPGTMFSFGIVCLFAGCMLVVVCICISANMIAPCASLL